MAKSKEDKETEAARKLAEEKHITTAAARELLPKPEPKTGE